MKEIFKHFHCVPSSLHLQDPRLKQLINLGSDLLVEIQQPVPLLRIGLESLQNLLNSRIFQNILDFRILHRHSSLFFADTLAVGLLDGVSGLHGGLLDFLVVGFVFETNVKTFDCFVELFEVVMGLSLTQPTLGISRLDLYALLCVLQGKRVLHELGVSDGTVCVDDVIFGVTENSFGVVFDGFGVFLLFECLVTELSFLFTSFRIDVVQFFLLLKLFLCCAKGLT